MAQSREGPHVLALPEKVSRVGLTNYIENWEKQLCERAGAETSPAPEPTAYHEVPAWYTEGEEGWPVLCNLQCCACMQEIGGPPFFVPTEMKDVAASATNTFAGSAKESAVLVRRFKRGAVTCGISCSVAFINFSMHREEAFRCRERAVQLYHAMFRENVVSVEPSPMYTNLRRFGGSMTDEELRKKVKSLEPALMSVTSKIKCILDRSHVLAGNPYCWELGNGSGAASAVSAASAAENHRLSAVAENNSMIDDILADINEDITAVHPTNPLSAAAVLSPAAPAMPAAPAAPAASAAPASAAPTVPATSFASPAPAAPLTPAAPTASATPFAPPAPAAPAAPAALPTPAASAKVPNSRQMPTPMKLGAAPKRGVTNGASAPGGKTAQAGSSLAELLGL